MSSMPQQFKMQNNTRQRSKNQFKQALGSRPSLLGGRLFPGKLAFLPLEPLVPAIPFTGRHVITHLVVITD
jgi:hypothetical protein